MQFRKFHSLENVKQKLVDTIHSHGFAGEKYVVTEKVHGANFGIHLNNETKEVTFSRRGGFLLEGETFYGLGGDSPLEQQLKTAILGLGTVFCESKSIRVYGELFGGSTEGCS